MSRLLFDMISTNQHRECVDREGIAKEQWYKTNKNDIWNENMRPICCRVEAICNDKIELARKLMDSQDEYFRYCQVPPRTWPIPPTCNPNQPEPRPFCCNNETAVRQPDCCDECCQDPTIPMKCVPECQKALLFEGLSHEGGGAVGYLKSKLCHQYGEDAEIGSQLRLNRWNSGLPEYRFCRPPTVNAEYAWRIKEHLKCMKAGCCPRTSKIGPQFYRNNNNGVLCKPDCAPFHFP